MDDSKEIRIYEEPDEIIILNSNFDDKTDLIMMMQDKDRFDHAFLGSSRIPELLYTDFSVP